MNRFRLSSLLCGAILLFCTACSKDEPEPLIFDEPTSQQAPSSIPLRSLEEVKAEALQIFSALQPSLRSARELRIENAQLLPTDALRSAEHPSDGPLGGVYLINFANNGGYILLSEDRRDEPILALATEGNLNPDDELPAPAVMMLSNAMSGRNLKTIDYIEDECPINEHCPVRPDTPVDNTTYREYGPWEVIESVEPLVRVSWDQEDPLNAKLDLIDGLRPPVGCVATALMQLMSYHRLPASYNWDEITRDYKSVYSSDALGTLGKEIGRADLLNMQYSLKESGAYDRDIPRTLWHYGYSSGDLEAYSPSKIDDEIRHQRPVYVAGSAFKRTYEEKYTVWFLFRKTHRYETYPFRHGWLIDGLKVLSRKVKQIRTRDKAVVNEWHEKKSLVHCNIGYASTFSNGYYLHGDFHVNKGALSDELRALVKQEGDAYYFQFDLKMIANIQPR